MNISRLPRILEPATLSTRKDGQSGLYTNVHYTLEGETWHTRECDGHCNLRPVPKLLNY